MTYFYYTSAEKNVSYALDAANILQLKGVGDNQTVILMKDKIKHTLKVPLPVVLNNIKDGLSNGLLVIDIDTLPEKDKEKGDK